MIRIKCLFGKHNWNGCMCKDCGETRNEGHTWNGCKCKVCGYVEEVYVIEPHEM